MIQGSYPMSNQQMPMQLESHNRCLQRRVCKIACVGFCSYLYPACTQSMYIHLTQMRSDVGNEWTKRMEWSRCAEMVPLHFSRQSYVWDLISLPALCQRKLQVFFISCVRNISILRCDNGLQAFASGSCIRLHFSHICLIYLVYEVYMVPGPNCWLKSTSTGAKQLPTGVPTYLLPCAQVYLGTYHSFQCVPAAPLRTLTEERLRQLTMPLYAIMLTL